VIDQDTENRMAAIIEESFNTRPMPSGVITRGEVIRRVEMAKEVFLTLVNESKWSAQRALDHLPQFLTRGIDGSEPIPEWAKIAACGNSMWGVEAAARVVPELRLSALARRK
jgi:hypothetical protein